MFLKRNYWKKHPGPNLSILDFPLPLIQEKNISKWFSKIFSEYENYIMIINYEDHNISLALVDDLLTRTTQIVLDPDEAKVPKI